MVGETAGELSSHFTTGAMVVYIIEWMKQSPKFHWIDEDTKKVARAISAVAAVAASTGITWQASVSTGDYAIHGATLAVIAAFVWECTKQFVVQQVFYDLFNKNDKNKDGGW